MGVVFGMPINKKCDWVLIPARNEMATLPDIIREIQQLTTDSILVVDSQSTDDTAEVARSMGAVVIAAPKVGYWNALHAGYQFLLRETDCTTVTQLDADGQHDPVHISRLKSCLTPSMDAQWIVGSRYQTGSQSAMVLDLGQRLLRLYCETHTGRPYGDVSSGFWVLNRAAMQLFCQFDVPRQSADLAIRIYAAQQGLYPLEIPTEMGPRLSGQSMHDGLKRRLIHLFNVYQDVQSLNRKHSDR